MADSSSARAVAVQKKRALDQSFLKHGVTIALLSSVLYAVYTAFSTAGQLSGAWAAMTATASAAALTFVVPTVASALNDFISGIWALIFTGAQGKMSDFGKTLKTRPGRIMIGAAIVGGPIASVAYIMAIAMAGTIVVPIAALNPAVGTILSAILYKQKIGARQVVGLLIMIVAGVMIAIPSITGDAGSNMVLGLLLGLVAAIGWGAEGCIGGYAGCMIDAQVQITIRQVTSGIVEMFVVLPLLAAFNGVAIGQAYTYVGTAVTDFPTIIMFVISGWGAYKSFQSWYRGNAMCGTALGMACNGTYSFTAPLLTWIVCGIAMGIDGYALAPIAWAAAVVMVIGIFVLAVDPSELKKNQEA